MEEQNTGLEEMRAQIALLRKKLEAHEIVNDRLLRETMKTKVSVINSIKRKQIVASIFCFIIFPLEVRLGMFSLPFVIATCLMVLFCLVSTICMHRSIDRTNLMTEDLKTVSCIMSRFKRQYDLWLYRVTPALLIPWISWLCYDVSRNKMAEHIAPVWLCLPLLIGAAVGCIIGLRYHHSATNAATSIVEQVEEV